MDRLTTKNYYSFAWEPKYDTFYPIEAKNKLGKLEDLEEQTGCPLEVLFKALREGVYWKYGDHEDRKYEAELCFDGKDWIFVNLGVKLSDYKKTWWLKADKNM